ncbi:hypothetical protein AN217_06370 [Streptomyces qinglanensis]|uniref:Uncharacterized protein n=1 Tax=Streptomyces qinglanensis TaxID=943816 RepID=A0A1E7K115_9ACTN|nr:hypothetical protein AN217_06370 [Streptomyces qinglanensis]OEV25595.1 hypothetical protein AN220_12940 [Streptomyces nanshensis]
MGILLPVEVSLEVPNVRITILPLILCFTDGISSISQKLLTIVVVAALHQRDKALVSAYRSGPRSIIGILGHQLQVVFFQADLFHLILEFFVEG